MGELRAYALAVGELRGVVGAKGAQADQVRTLVRQAFAQQTAPLRVRDLIGPLYRRVPGRRVVRTDDPTPEDLDVLLAGTPVPPARAGASWRLVEGVVAGLAWSSTAVGDSVLPTGLLAATGLPLPPLAGLTEGWCALGPAAEVPGLRRWLAASDAWVAAAARAVRPRPDVVVLGLP